MTPIQSQLIAIKAHLDGGRSITPMDALRDYRCFRLAARINDLRNRGEPIVTIMRSLPDGKRYAEYIKTRAMPPPGVTPDMFS